MTGFLKFIVFASLTGFTAYPLLAAEALPESQSQEVSEAESSGGPDEPPGGSTPDTENADDAVAEEDSPSRFIPTEQISQDLGVSFPADI